MQIPVCLDKSEFARHVADILTGVAQWNSIEEYLTDKQISQMDSLLEGLKEFVISIQSASTGSSIHIVFLCKESESLNNLGQLYRNGWLRKFLESLTYVVIEKDMVESIEIDEDWFTTNMEKCQILGILQRLFTTSN